MLATKTIVDFRIVNLFVNLFVKFAGEFCLVLLDLGSLYMYKYVSFLFWPFHNFDAHDQAAQTICGRPLTMLMCLISDEGRWNFDIQSSDVKLTFLSKIKY